MVRRELWEAIREAAQTERRSVSALARRFDLDRKTVRRCLRQAMWQPYRRRLRTDALSAAYAEWVRARAPQVQRSAQILYQELRHKGYQGGYDTVKRWVAPLRAACLQAQRALTRVETPPGLTSQIDGGEACVCFGQRLV